MAVDEVNKFCESDKITELVNEAINALYRSDFDLDAILKSLSDNIQKLDMSDTAKNILFQELTKSIISEIQKAIMPEEKSANNTIMIDGKTYEYTIVGNKIKIVINNKEYTIDNCDQTKLTNFIAFIITAEKALSTNQPAQGRTLAPARNSNGKGDGDDSSDWSDKANNAGINLLTNITGKIGTVVGCVLTAKDGFVDGYQNATETVKSGWENMICMLAGALDAGATAGLYGGIAGAAVGAAGGTVVVPGLGSAVGAGAGAALGAAGGAIYGALSYMIGYNTGASVGQTNGEDIEEAAKAASYSNEDFRNATNSGYWNGTYW